LVCRKEIERRGKDENTLVYLEEKIRVKTFLKIIGFTYIISYLF